MRISNILFVGAMLLCAPAHANTPSLEDFSSTRGLSAVTLSPDGSQIIFVRNDSDDDPRSAYAEVRSTGDIQRGGVRIEVDRSSLQGANWINDDLILLELTDQSRGRQAGKHFFVVFDNRGRLVARMPNDEGSVVDVSPDGSQLFLSYDSTDDQIPDIHSFAIESGKVRRILRGSSTRYNYKIAADGEIRLSSIIDVSSGVVEHQYRGDSSEAWKTYQEVTLSGREIYNPIMIDRDGRIIVAATLNKNTIGMYARSVRGADVHEPLYVNENYDIGDQFGARSAVVNRQGELLGVTYADDKRRTHWFEIADQKLQTEFEALFPDNLVVMSPAASNGMRILRISGDSEPGHFYLVRPGDGVQPLGSARPALAGKVLGSEVFMRYEARDGTGLYGYLTLPAGDGPWPLLIMPHGGPWTRDIGGWQEWPQIFASRGYAVAQPQFRGSTGFGSKIWRAGDREWGFAMQDDIDDFAKALQSLAQIDDTKPAIFGWSYGGYATYVAATQRPSLYRCAIAGAAISNLDDVSAELFGSNIYTKLVQRPTVEGRNPIEALSETQIPLLIVHGEEDQIVPLRHALQAANTLDEAGRDFELLRLPSIGHFTSELTPHLKSQLFADIFKWMGQECSNEPVGRTASQLPVN